MSHAPLDAANASDNEYCPPSALAGGGGARAADNSCRSSNRTEWGAEPLCCGQGCETPTCVTALWNSSLGAKCIPAGSSSANCGTGMVKAGSGTCVALSSAHLDGVLCCKTAVAKEQEERSATRDGARAGEAACLTYPTRVQAYVWSYVWPSD
jgi:hypothetical protein